MNCIKCGSSNLHSFFVEEIVCHHCKEINCISYTICQDCGLICRDVEGEVIESMLVTEDGMEPFDVKGNFNDTMSGLIHRCIRCNTIVFEIGPNQYHCPECGFEWGIF